MKNKHIVLVAIFLLFMIGCNTSADKSISYRAKKGLTRTEDFDLFFKKFNADSVFQYSRVVYPLKIKTAIENSDNWTTKFLLQKEYKYFDLTKYDGQKSIINKTRVSSKKMTIHYAVEDTGIGLDYYFITKNGRWWLSYVEDYSD